MNPKFKILLVEDYAEERATLLDILANPEYSFVEAENAVQALMILESDKFDLLIVDIGLPGMNGLELVRQAKLRNLTSAPVIVITGEPNPIYRKEAAELKVFRYFIKDELQNKDLRKAVSDAIAKGATE